MGSKITKMCFRVASAPTLRQQSHIHCINNSLYENTQNVGQARKPAAFGVLDYRLGTSQKDAKCETCGLSLLDCIGHFGYIDLQLPVFHVGYFRYILSTLQSICLRCSRVLLGPKDRAIYSLRLRRKNLAYLDKKSLHKEILDKCKKVKLCSFCSQKTGTVKKTGLYKIINQEDRKGDFDVAKSDLAEMIETLTTKDPKEGKELKAAITKNRSDLLDPIKVKQLFEKIPEEDLSFLLIKEARPEDLIVTRIAVPPACIRPSVVNDFDASNEDDLTIKLSEIIFVNDVIAKRRAAGSQMSLMVEDWDFLQLHVALYINSETSGIPFNMRPKKATRGLVQRLKGKHGRFRGNLSGKRVDFSSRSVISPNPNLQIDEVGVPEYIAKILTFPEMVNKANIEVLRELVINGADTHPGANFIRDSESGNKIFLRYGNRKKSANELKYGDIVERHLSDGDRVLFNRQPSLHKLSIMCHSARVHKHRTLQFNECVCTPYNADFDGDEMNLHLPQTLEARAEAATLMNIKNNIVTPRNGEPLIAAIQDFITGSFLMTHKDTFFNRSQAMQIISSIIAGPDEQIMIDLPPPCIWKPKALWSGKQVFSLIIGPSKKDRTGLCLSTKTKLYCGKGDEMCANDGYILIKDGELLSGAVEKSVLGSGSKNNIFYILLRDVNSDIAARCMWRLGRVTSVFLMNRGFSLGIDDVTPTTQLKQKKQQLLDDGYKVVEEYIKSHKDGKLEAQPGNTTEETLELMILKELSNIREAAGKKCQEALGTKNAPLIMAMCGSKGSLINVSQMVACVGQQALRGARVPDGYGDRSLPHFDHREKTPLAKGFVENSFYSGLTATEFFFHTMAGREGLLDTAVKTAETGYMQRRLVKALEDLVSHYDGSVRNSRGDVIQFVYGDDSLDPVNMEEHNKPVNFRRLLEHVRALHPCPHEEVLGPDVMYQNALVAMDAWLSNGVIVNESFKDDVKLFLRGKQLDKQTFLDRYGHHVGSPAINSYERITTTQLAQFMDYCLDKYLRAKLEPGTAVGAICAQSIGEPATQMTLKTFHFAGVASMNITQGVPRIGELINATKAISTPIITAALMDGSSVNKARAVKMRLEKTTLSQICAYLDTVVRPDNVFVKIKLDRKRIRLLRLNVDEDSVERAIIEGLKIKTGRVKIIGDDLIAVEPKSLSDLWSLRESLCDVIVSGIKNIKRAAIRVDADQHYLMIEGVGLREVMATYGVNPNKSYSNNVLEMAACLGVEAGRATIIKEIRETMSNHGISIDERHLKLLADLMTYRGEVLGITRFGLAKMKECALMLASVR